MIAATLVSFRRPAWLSIPLAIGIAIVVFWLAVTLLAPLMSPYAPLDMVGRRLQAPSWSHWLGTDALGRDVLSRTLYGAQHSIPIAIVVVALSVTIGAMLGAISGYSGGLLGSAIMLILCTWIMIKNLQQRKPQPKVSPDDGFERL